MSVEHANGAGDPSVWQASVEVLALSALPAALRQIFDCAAERGVFVSIIAADVTKDGVILTARGRKIETIEN